MRKHIGFLSLKQVLELHRISLAQFGGTAGIRNQGLLEAAIAMPRPPLAANFSI